VLTFDRRWIVGLALMLVTVLSHAADPPAPAPPAPTAPAAPPADPLAAKAEAFARQFLAGEHDKLAPQMAAETRAAMTAEVASEIRRRLTDDHGPVARVHPAWIDLVSEPYTRYRVPIETESKIFDLQIVFDPDHLVTGFFHTAHVEPKYGPVKSTRISPAEADLARSYGGHWGGAIEIPGTPLPVAVDLTFTSGQWSGTFDSPAQGATAIPLRNVRVTADGIEMTIQGIPGEPTFRGKLAEGAITGTFSQLGQTFPFRLERKEVSRPARPQEPPLERPYREHDVRVESTGGALAGTLVLPSGDGPFPAALLLSGSGAQNRDSELLGHKPFLVLADHLARAGVATLRLDDRGVGGSAGNLARSTTEDLAADAIAGVRFLTSRPEIDGKRVGLIGHSDGGIVAPLAATRSEEVAFVVMLAGPGVPGHEVLVHQMGLGLESAGVTKETIERAKAEERKLVDMVLAGAERDAIVAQVRRLIEAQGGSAADADDAAAAQAAAVTADQFESPWFRYFLAHDPRPVLARLSVPVLAVVGELDLQVDPDQNLPEIRKALARAETNDVTVLELEGLNHLLQTAKTGSVLEYGSIEETMAPRALELISSWIIERFGRTPTAENAAANPS
jgi:pimeloyl-ACP methyl ester carboxylesterase